MLAPDPLCKYELNWKLALCLHKHVCEYRNIATGAYSFLGVNRASRCQELELVISWSSALWVLESWSIRLLFDHQVFFISFVMSFLWAIEDLYWVRGLIWELEYFRNLSIDKDSHLAWSFLTLENESHLYLIETRIHNQNTLLNIWGGY